MSGRESTVPPSECLRDVGGLRLVSLPTIGLALRGTPPEQRLRRLLDVGGAVFHEPPYERFVSRPSVAVAGLGGLLFDLLPDDLPTTVRLHGLAAALALKDVPGLVRSAAAASAFMTYLNPRDRDWGELAEVALDAGHLSVLHTMSMSVLIAGHSSAVEHEITSQRDMVHLSRLTVARTQAQNDPPLRVPEASLLPAAAEVLETTRRALTAGDSAQSSGADLREARNTLFPSAKASVVLLSGTVRNLLAFSEKGIGKERELEGLCRELRRQLGLFAGLSEQ
ncbi:hypothetical protein [Streptomyces sp. NPDC014685]|uniref:hypothetical protein n=1 Tax=Streptomyces sp. NPDC014685 TaxID=3364881 RepID=UPI0036F8FC7D